MAAETGDLCGSFDFLAELVVLQGDPLDDSRRGLDLLAQLSILLPQPGACFLKLVAAAGL